MYLQQKNSKVIICEESGTVWQGTQQQCEQHPAMMMGHFEIVEALPEGFSRLVFHANVPFDVPSWRIKAVTTLMGLKQQVDSIIDALPEPNRTVAFLAWNEGSRLERYSPMLLQLAVALQLTEYEIDNIFIQAANLQA